jgi:hypothetical protein
MIRVRANEHQYSVNHAAASRVKSGITLVNGACGYKEQDIYFDDFQIVGALATITPTVTPNPDGDHHTHRYHHTDGDPNPDGDHHTHRYHHTDGDPNPDGDKHADAARRRLRAGRHLH